MPAANSSTAAREQDGRMTQPAHVDQQQAGQQRRPRGQQHDPGAAGRIHLAAVDVAEGAEQVLVGLAGGRSPRRRAHPTLQLGLVQQRPAAPAAAVPSPGLFAGKTSGSGQQVLVARQNELPIEAAHPGAASQPRHLQRHRPPRRPLRQTGIAFPASGCRLCRRVPGGSSGCRRPTVRRPRPSRPTRR